MQKRERLGYGEFFLDEFRTGFYTDRNIQGDTLTYGRPGLEKTKEKALLKPN